MNGMNDLCCHAAHFVLGLLSLMLKKYKQLHAVEQILR